MLQIRRRFATQGRPFFQTKPGSKTWERTAFQFCCSASLLKWEVSEERVWLHKRILGITEEQVQPIQNMEGGPVN